MKGLPPESVARTSDVIARQVKHMTGLVDDLLDVSRVSTGLVVLDRVEVDIKQVISDAVEQVRPLLESRRHQLTLQVAFEDAVVIGDYKRLVQVMANLLNNAAKYTPEGGNICVELGATVDSVSLAVADNGIGISAELLPNVFTLFTQAERTPDRSEGGLGLGLSLVKSLVELHGGSVAVNSAGLTHGSKFSVRLPRAMRSPVRPPAEAEDASMTVEPGQRLMIVDDNVDAAHMLAMFLGAKGFTVDVEHDPVRALALAGRHAYTAFLLDIGLPGMDGNALARQLRTLPAQREARLVAITGYGGRFDRESSLQAGFDDYLTKPADVDQILRVLAVGSPARPGADRGAALHPSGAAHDTPVAYARAGGSQL